MVCKLVDVVCVLNTASVKVAKRYHNNVIYVPNFIDKPTFENKYINEHIENVCFVGRVEKRKGIQELINAAKAFPEILFNIIGPIEDEDLKNRYSECEILGEVLIIKKFSIF
ncbi:MAG: glycosyltransferase [Dorea sp.]